MIVPTEAARADRQSVSPVETRGMPPAADLRWFVPELQQRPLAVRQAHVRNPLNGATIELDSGEYAVLAACEGCFSLDEHVARAARKLAAPPEHHAAFREVLERCASAGVLVPLSALVARFGTRDELDARTVSTVAIRTCDRPALLARLLASAARRETRGGEAWRWFVFDDSRAVDSERANRATLETCGVRATYMGRADAEALEAELRREFPDAKGEIAWLLRAEPSSPGTYGRPLNHALLRFAGQRFLAVDDDVVLEAHRPAMSQPGFAVNDRADELVWFASEDEMWRQCPTLDVDPLAAHASWLGLPLSAAWRRAEREGGTLTDLELPAHHGRRFAPEARILFTHSHACGDPGSALLPLQLLTLPGPSRRRLTERPEIAHNAFESRIDWRGQSRLRLSPKRILTFTTLTGIDNARLLPPVARSHRSEDVLLGIAAQCMYPSSWFVDLPFALPHLREPKKEWLAPMAGFMQEPLHVLYALIEENAATVAAEAPAARLERIGGLLLDFARMGDEALYEALRRHAVDAGSRTLFAIAEQMDDAELPAEWKRQLAPWLDSPAFVVDDRSVRARVLSPQAVQPLAQAYGRAMQAWPSLWRYCSERER
jgi:hypothetical protein